MVLSVMWTCGDWPLEKDEMSWNYFQRVPYESDIFVYLSLGCKLEASSIFTAFAESFSSQFKSNFTFSYNKSNIDRFLFLLKNNQQQQHTRIEILIYRYYWCVLQKCFFKLMSYPIHSRECFRPAQNWYAHIRMVKGNMVFE